MFANRPLLLQIVGLIVAVLLITIGLGYYKYVNDLKGIFGKTDKEKSEYIAFMVGEFIENEEATLVSLANALENDFKLSAALSAYRSQGNRAALRETLDQFRAELNVDILELIDIDQTVVYSTHYPDNIGKKTADWGVYEALDGEKLLLASKEQPEGLSIRELVPVRDNRQKIIGALMLGTRINDEFAKKMAGRTGAQIAFASSGGVLARSHADKMTADEKYLQGVHKSFYEKQPHFTDNDADHAAQLYTPFLLLDETVNIVVELDTSAEFERLQIIKKQVLIFSLGILIFALGLGHIFAFYLVRPLKQLELKSLQMIKRLSGEDLSVSGRNEVYSLVQAITLASDTLNVYTQKLADAKDQAEHTARYDHLTGLPNRLLLMDRMLQVLAAAKRKGIHVAVMFLDLDHFKTINDSLGHEVGDELLRVVSRHLLDSVRGMDTVARLGGDEFVVVLTELTLVKDAALVADKILAAVTREMQVAGNTLSVTGSIGISIYPEDGDDTGTLIKNADAAMYEAKASGRNAYKFFTGAMNERVVETLSIENGLRLALERSEFELFYQPKINIASGDIAGAEALVRWRHPEEGLIPPLRFIPVAEARGLIVPIGEWVLQTACKHQVQWRQAGLPNIIVAVNVSAAQFKRSNFLAAVMQAMRASGIAPDELELELTESTVMGDPDEFIKVFTDLATLGIKLAIDDFGTGYSSLSYLKRLPVSRLKIDQSFVRDICADSNAAAIAQAVIAMAQSLGLAVTAEGVETREQLEFLRQQGCDEAQGYYFAKPMPENEFRLLLAKSERLVA